MNLALNILSGIVVLACLVYIFKKKDRNIGILVMSCLLLAALISQIVLDEVVRAQMLAMKSVHSIKQTTAIVQLINWGKSILIFILAFHYYIGMKKTDEVDEA